jgi:DNA-binding IclR family transcriptional regulator
MHGYRTGIIREPRSLELVELLAFAELTAPQAAAALGIHPRTARGHLRTLAETGWVSGSAGPVRTYAAGMRPLAATWHILSNHPLVRLAAPVLTRLERDGLLVELAVPSYDAALALSRSPGGGWHARALPPHASAAGKLLLALRDDWRRARLSATLERFTPATLTDTTALEEELDATRARGYALEAGEHRDGWRAVAVPFASPRDPREVAAISAGGREPGCASEATVRRAFEAIASG